MSNNNTEVITVEDDDTSSFLYGATPTRSLRSWFGTFNNYPDDAPELMSAQFESIGVTRAVIGKEVGANGTPHLQWMVTFKQGKKHGDVRAFFPGSHIEACRNPDAAFEYCKKEGDVVCEIDNRRQGNRTDLNKVQDMIERGHDLRSVAMSAPSTFMKYPGGVQKYYELFNSNKTRSESWTIADHRWYFGPAGCGKTSSAVNELRTKGISYWKSSISRSGFFNGYDMQEAIIFDETRKDLMKFHTLLEVLDVYEHRVDIKNSSRNIVSDTIIITSNKDPYDMWKGRTDEDIKQLIRRLNGGIWQFKDSGKFDENGKKIMLPPVNVTRKLAAEYAKIPPAFENFVPSSQTTDNTIIVDSDDDDIRNRPPTPLPIARNMAPPAPKKAKRKL